MSRKVIAIIISAIAFWGCDPRYGMVDSNFKIAQESRLPKWFNIPSSLSRQDLTMDITIYVTPYEGIIAKMVLRGPGPEYKVLSEKIGHKRQHPLSEKQNYNEYPHCAIIAVNEVEEVFEQRRPEAIFYVSDDPKYTSVLKQKKTLSK
jgi:hypothetical protein